MVAPPVAQQEPRQLLAGPPQVAHRREPCPDQIAHRFVRGVRHPHGGQLASPVQPGIGRIGPWLRTAPRLPPFTTAIEIVSL
jgi:hypothetical protein